MNPMAFMQIKNLLEQFKMSHPKIPMFFIAASKSMDEGSIIEISVTTSDGKRLNTNMRVTAEDLKLVEQLKTMTNS